MSKVDAVPGSGADKLMTHHPDKRTILIGIDGATWSLIDKLIDQNKLPALERLKKEGSYGILKSTVPCRSPVAWNSIFTGVNPGKHGIFGFIKHPYNSANLEFYDSRDRKFPAVWNYTSYYGMDSVYINIPFSYPLEETRGVFISGLGTPSEDSSYTTAELKKYIRQHFPGYKIDFDEGVMSKKKDRSRFSKECFSILDNRLSLASYLFNSRNWQFFSLVIRAMDIIQHFYWNDEDFIRAAYQKIDDFLSFVMNGMRPKDTLIIVSDHGFTKLKGMIHLVNYFIQEGCTVIKQRRMGCRGFDMHLVKKIALFLAGPKALEIVKRQPRLLGLIFSHLPAGEYSYLRSIDWRSSLISYVEGSGGLANFNPALKQDRNKLNSFFEELKRKACNLRDEKGSEVFEDVYKTEDILWPGAPDVIFHSKEGYFVDGYDFHDDSIFGENKNGYTAFHDENGIVALFNSEVNKGHKIQPCSVYDILPTIFYIFGLDMPDYLDGKVIEEAFSKKIYYKTSNHHKDIFMQKRDERAAINAGENERLIAQVKSLGYM